MQEYDQNLQENQHEKQTNIEEMQALIGEKEDHLDGLNTKSKHMRNLLYRLVEGKYHQYLERMLINQLKEHVKQAKHMRRQTAYSKNFMYRRKMRLLFRSWKTISNEWGKERINNELLAYENTQRHVHLDAWNQKVDALKLYMAQLQEKIRIEVAAREDLALTYEQSLNKGVGQLNEETRTLADNPLVKEISLIVAQELVRKS